MVRKCETGHNPDSIFDDSGIERLLKEAVAKRGMTLTQYFAEAVKQQLVRNGLSSTNGNGGGKTKQHSGPQSLLKSTRDSTEIIRDILMLGDVGKTRIKYEVGLDHKQAERYLSFLIKGEFLERVETNHRGTIYRPSRLGLELLQKIDGVQDILEDAKLKALR